MTEMRRCIHGRTEKQVCAKCNAMGTTPPRTPTTLDAAWEALAADIHANGYSVRDAIARHRPLIEAAAHAPAEPAPLDAPWLTPHPWQSDGNATCVVCGHGPGRTIHDVAPDPAQLDVERLARALHDYSGWYTDHTGPVCLACTEDAADIAREYAKKPQPSQGATNAVPLQRPGFGQPVNGTLSNAKDPQS